MFFQFDKINCVLLSKFEAMKFIQRYELNVIKWDALVESNQAMCYHYSWYMDATAKNWAVFVNEDYSKGLAISYNQVLGQKILYPTLLGRTTAFLGMTLAEVELALIQLKKEFAIGHLQTDFELKNLKMEIKTYQTLENVVINKLSKRMLQKALRNNIEIKEVLWKDSFHFIEQELAEKVSMLRGENLKKIEILFERLHERSMLKSTGIFKNNICCGVLYLVQDGKRLLYIKGAATKEIKEEGGMYLAMMQSIDLAISSNLVFDFGGSSIPGIKRFFNGFGGKDQNYWVHSWNNAPFWFQLIRKINKIIK